MSRALSVWAIFPTISMLLYAFAGVAFWSPLQPGDGARFMLLVIFHFIGPFAYLISKIP